MLNGRRNAPSCDRNVAPRGRWPRYHGLYPWGSIEQGALSQMCLTYASILQLLRNLLSCRQVAGWIVTLLRRKPRLRAVTHFGVQARSPMPMNVERVPFEALKERSRVCFGGFRLPARSRFGEGRPFEACGGATGISPWGSTLLRKAFLILTDSHVP
jgi:hypothetical protein